MKRILMRHNIYFHEVDELMTISSIISIFIGIENKHKIYTRTLASLNNDHKMVITIFGAKTVNILNSKGITLKIF